MRIYIHKRSLEAALYELVEEQNEKLLEILTQIVNFRLNKKGCNEAYIEKLLFVPARMACYILNLVLTGAAFYLLGHYRIFLDFPLGRMFFMIESGIWLIYLACEGFLLHRVKKEAFRYVVVDELIARKMVEIGTIVS